MQENLVMDQDTLLHVSNLKTHFKLDEGILKAVDGVNYKLRRNMTLGVIGESGCGKSVTAHSIMRTVQSPGKIVEGNIHYRRPDGQVVDLTTMHPDGQEIRGIRGKEISMIFQEPMASLSPVHTIGKQMIEMLLLHKICANKLGAFEFGCDMLKKVGLARVQQVMTSYPHQLSGGMCQRAMIAIALCCSPQILIADEPTTALDVTVQANIVDMLKDLQHNMNMSIIYITHDMGVIAEMADDIAVMYLGKIVEIGSAKQIFHNPLHPYTKRLLRSIPTIDGKQRKRLEAIRGNVPIPLNLEDRCGFCPRCDDAMDICAKRSPNLIEIEPEHFVSCFLYSETKKEEIG